MNTDHLRNFVASAPVTPGQRLAANMAVAMLAGGHHDAAPALVDLAGLGTILALIKGGFAGRAQVSAGMGRAPIPAPATGVPRRPWWPARPCRMVPARLHTARYPDWRAGRSVSNAANCEKSFFPSKLLCYIEF